MKKAIRTNCRSEGAVRAALSLAILGSLALPNPGFASPDTFGLGDGHTGSVTLVANGPVNQYIALSAPAATGDTSVTVADTTGYVAGDLVMILQTTGIVPSLPSGDGTGGAVDISTNPVGTFEFARVLSVVGTVNGTLNLTSGLVNNFAANVTQVIQVPEYTDLDINGMTIDAPAWNGSVGGVVVFFATGTVTNSGAIDVSGLGFRGGVFVNEPAGTMGCTSLDQAPNRGAQKGEGIQVDRYGLSGTNFTGYGVVSNGAGGGICHNSGGGGGGNGGLGGNGGNTWIGDGARPYGGRGGRQLVYSQFDHMSVGGGAGSGHGNNSVATNGGAGGGAIYIRAGTFTGTGSIVADGQSGANTPGGPVGGNDAAGGGGAGGTIAVRVSNSLDCTAVSAQGGNGGSVTFNTGGQREHGPGGGGGGGRILLQSSNIEASPSDCPANVASGVAGTTHQSSTGNPINYGATPASSTGSYVGIITVPSGGGFVPVLPAPVITSPTDSSFTNNNRPPISGTDAQANSQVVVYIDGTVACTSAVAAGAWSCSRSAALAEGTHSVSAVTVYQGTQSASSTVVTFTVKTIPPPAPVITAPLNNSFTNNNRPPIEGNAEAFSTVVVRDSGGNPICSGTTSVAGAWTCTPASALPDATYVIAARATDRAGNTGPASAAVTFTVKTVPPPAPVITSPPNNSFTNNNRPPISGTAEAFSIVVVRDSGANLICSGTTSGAGAWTCTPASGLAEATYVISARATDRAGNTGPASTTVTFTVKTTPPPAPVISGPPNNSFTTNNRPTISGTAEPFSTVTVKESNGNTICSGTTTVGGTWSCTPASALPDATYVITARATDRANNTGPASNAVTFTVKANSPPAPVISAPLNNSVSANNRPTISGSAEPFSTVTVRNGSGAVVCSGVTSSSGAWSCTPTTALADGLYTITAQATDRANNVSPSSTAVTFRVDTSPPAAPVISGPANNSYVLVSRPPISGTAVPGATVNVSVDGVVVCSAMADAAGNWSCVPTTPLSNGSHTVVATATSSTGRTGPASTPVSFNVNTLAPAVPAITGPSDGSTTNQNPTTISGTAEPGSTVNVSVDGNPACTATADANGNWTCTPGSPLAPGQHVVTATATNSNGTSGPTSSGFTLESDHTLRYRGSGFGCNASGGEFPVVALFAILALTLLRSRSPKRVPQRSRSARRR